MAEKNEKAATPKASALQIPASRFTPVNCATGSNVKTEDGARHEFRRAFYTPALPSNDKAGWDKAIAEYFEVSGKLNAGETFDILLADGTVSNYGKVATDDIPKKSKRTVREIKDKDGKVTGEEVTIHHGQNVTASHPYSYAELLDCLIEGMKVKKARQGTQRANEEFRQDSTRGRKAAELDVEDFD